VNDFERGRGSGMAETRIARFEKRRERASNSRWNSLRIRGRARKSSRAVDGNDGAI
jgi:hypothetical protein